MSMISMQMFLSLVPFQLIAQAQVQIDKIQLPPGFQIGVYASGLPDARSMTLSPAGNLYVGTRKGGAVYVVTPDKTVRSIAKGLDMPNGVAFRDGALYVAEVSRLLKFDGIEKNWSSHQSRPS